MNYARLYDSTVDTDYFGAMSEIEARMEMAEMANGRPISGGHLLALVDTLRQGTLNEDQRQAVLALRMGIVAFVTQGAPPIGAVDDGPHSGHAPKADETVSVRL